MTVCVAVISRAAKPSLLFLRTPNGWALPTIDYPGGWIADEASALTRLLGSRLGLRLTALRHLEEGPPHLCEFEQHDPTWTPPENGRWVSRTELDALPLATPEQRLALERWFAEADEGHASPLRAPWERPGWFVDAAAWIQDQLQHLGCPVTGPVVQRKAMWGWSCLLSAPTSRGDFYFKADYARPPAEPAVIHALAEGWPRNVPEIVAVDSPRRWMLMRDFGGQPLDDLPLECWEGAARCFAEIQIDSVANLDRWLALGCPDHRPERMVAHIRALLDDTSAMLSGQAGGFTEEEVATVRALEPRLRELWTELADHGLPATVVQQDFRPGNLVVRNHEYLYYDWSDTVVGHPFFSVCRFLNYIWTRAGDTGRDSQSGPSARWSPWRHRIRDAYLEPWMAFASRDRLLQAFRLARQLNALYLAVRWRLELPYLDAGSPWGREIAAAVPAQLRDVLDGMALLQRGQWLMDLKEEGEAS